MLVSIPVTKNTLPITLFFSLKPNKPESYHCGHGVSFLSSRDEKTPVKTGFYFVVSFRIL
jgi:hypothetical protein